MIRSIFVPLGEGFSSRLLLDAALSVAKPTHAHIRAMFIRPAPESALADMPTVMMSAGATREAVERESRRAAAVEKTRFKTWRADNNISDGGGGGEGVDSWFATWSDRVGEFETLVARYGRVSDLIVLQRAAPGSFGAQRCFDAAVFESGRPVLLVAETLPIDVTDHVLIAWNGSLEATRAVFGAMALLRRAKNVSIFTAQQEDAESADSSDLADLLSMHGIHVQIVMRPWPESSVGEALIGAANAQRASLIVMGAYTHSRLRQLFLGGVTRRLLTRSPVPLLMSH